ncbi:MAG: hypothetical protein K2G89_08850 [Lachnospiraceae bacterium]|nr:hypothetical protein [Lachnospiraceae bacterium]
MRKTKLAKSLTAIVLSVALVTSELAPAVVSAQAYEDSETVISYDTADEAETAADDVEDTAAYDTAADVTESTDTEAEDASVTEDTSVTEDVSVTEDTSVTEDASVTEDTSETEDALVPEDYEAYNGTPSKVIGIRAQSNFNTRTDASGNTIYYKYPVMGEYVAAPGKPESYKDAATGLYLYNGRYYRYCDSRQGYVVLSYPATFVSGVVRDENTRLYNANGKTYRYVGRTEDGRDFVTAEDEVVYLGNYASTTAMNEALRPKWTDGSYMNYIVYNGRYFSAYSIRSIYISGGPDSYYVYADDEMLINASEVSYSWNEVSFAEKVVTPDNKPIYIAYEIEGNTDADFMTEEGNMLQTDNGCTPPITVVPGASASIRVRAVYYTVDKAIDVQTGNSYNIYHTYKTGPWSDTFTYTNRKASAEVVPALNVSAKLEKDVIMVSWNRYARAEQYYMQMIKSNMPLNVNASNWNDYYGNSAEELTNLKAQNPDFKWSRESYYTSKTTYKYSCDSNYQYYYFVVCVSSVIGYTDTYINNRIIANVASATAATADYAPQVQNVKASKATNGNIVLTWTPVWADVRIYAYESPNFPAYYNYYAQNASGTVVENGVNKTKYFSDVLQEADPGTKRLVDNKVLRFSTSGSSGEYELSSSSLEYGKKYYFVVHTIDTSSYDMERSPIYTMNGVAFTKYNTMSPASKMVSATRTLSKPGVTTLSSKKSIKLTLSNGATGYEIYKKSGKKWKKLTVTTDNFYLDKELKENTTYTYRVRTYSYDKDSKKKAYSDYTIVSATTGTVNVIKLTAVKKSAKSVQLKWTKVTGATRYEIYRSNEYSGDPSVIAKKYATSNYETYLADNKFERIKTIKKASTTSYTDKGLAADEGYTYTILAFFKNGKKEAYVTDTVSVSMAVVTPKNLKTVNTGSSVKATWDKDANAKSYMVSYRVYDCEGNAKATVDTVKTTKKASYTIKGLKQGEYATVKVRAVGKNGKYSSWSGVSQGISLSGAKGVSAKNVTVKNAAGKSVQAVKITWKKVSGAKYYKVYRTTRKPTYYADSKMYAAAGTTISKEANDDENNDKVGYREYYNISDSIVGTSAIDYAKLDVGVSYYYTVVAYGDYNTKIASYASYDYDSYTTPSTTAGSGSYSKVTFNAKLTVTAKATKGKVTLKWNKITGATKYVVYRSTKKNGTYKKIGTVKKSKKSFVDKKAKKGTTYYYKVVAVGTTPLKSTLEVTSSAKKIKAK